MTRLFERFRPTSWDEVIGQSKAVAAIANVRAAGGLGGQAFFVTGKSGTGKSTIARLIAAEIAGALATDEVNAADVDLDYVRRMEADFAVKALPLEGGPSGRAWIFNEAHAMRKPILTRLLTTLEMLPPHVVVVFTTTNDNQEAMFEDFADAHPLLSRCVAINLSSQGIAKPFAEHVQRIAQAEGLDGRPLADYLKLAERCKGNMRAMFQAVESGALKA